jgi:hypothetical protein
MSGHHDEVVVDFSLTRSGLFYKLLQRLGLEGYSRKGFLVRSLVISGVAWLPLLMLSMAQGLAWGDKVEITFLKDFATHARFLVIIPLLIFAEGSVDFRLKELTSQFFHAGILNETDIPRYNIIKSRINRLSESLLADIVILLIVASNIITRFTQSEVPGGHWVFLPGQDGNTISWAGIWAAGFSLTIFQYLILRWLWRWVIWVIYFKKIAAIPLKLNAAHPDLAGGLGFLGLPPGPFLQVTLALSILFSTIISERIVFLQHTLKDYYTVMGGFALVIIIINVLPLLVFLKPMITQRRKAIFQYSALIQEHHREFDEKWLIKNDQENMLGMPEASSMTDLNSSFETVMHMRFFPFNIKIMLSSIIISILPMIPVLAFEYNLVDIIQQVFKLIM